MSPSGQGIVDGNLDSPDIQLYTGDKRLRSRQGDVSNPDNPESDKRPRPARLKYTKKKNKKRKCW